MRVAIFTDNDFNKVNGVTTTLTAVLAHAPADVKPRIYTASSLPIDHPDYLALPSIGVPIPFYSEMRMYVPRWREYLRRVREDGVSVLHLTTPGPLGLMALRVARATGLPLVGSFHTNLGSYTALLSGSTRLGHWMDLYMRWMYGRCGEVLVPSAATRETLAAAGLQRPRLTVWPRGVDTALFTPARRSPHLRQRWGATADHVVLLYVGRLSREKGLDMLPPMMEQLRRRGVRYRLVLAGDGPYRLALAERCPDAVFAGTLGRERLASVFASADLFIFPSRTDTAGNVVLEAQASGLPVLVSDEGGPRENMLPGATGLVGAGTDASAWADAAAAMLFPEARRREMAAAARDYALRRRWESALVPLFDAYRRMHTTGGARTIVPAA